MRASHAPQIPAGRRPVVIQSRFIRPTKRSAVIDTTCERSSNCTTLKGTSSYPHLKARRKAVNVQRGIDDRQLQTELAAQLEENRAERVHIATQRLCAPSATPQSPSTHLQSPATCAPSARDGRQCTGTRRRHAAACAPE